MFQTSAETTKTGNKFVNQMSPVDSVIRRVLRLTMSPFYRQQSKTLFFIVSIDIDLRFTTTRSRKNGPSSATNSLTTTVWGTTTQFTLVETNV